MSVYIAQTAVEAAQTELERHLSTGFDGRCATCRELEPCAGRYAAHATFARLGTVLPRRREVERPWPRLGRLTGFPWFTAGHTGGDHGHHR